MKRTYRILTLLLIVAATVGLFGAQAFAVSNLTVTKSASVLYVKSGNTVKYKTTYKSESVQTTSALAVRTGPSTKYSKVKTLAKNTTVTRVGQLSGCSWDIVKLDGNYYFVNRNHLKTSATTKVEDTSSTKTKAKYSPTYFRRMGVIRWNGWRWTWYSQRVLPGGGLKIPGRHVDSNGYVCDANDYICLASSTLSKGTVVSTPFGKKGKIYDSGCARGTLDVYVNW
jgi:hypothetical protein